MCGNREGIYTQFANSIDKFILHKITKEDLYNDFVAMVEMSDESERNDRVNFQNHMKQFEGEIAIFKDIPISNWDMGLDMIRKY